MDDDELDRLAALAEMLINSLSTLTVNFVFLNAIYRNINSGENTMAWHQTPYENKLLNIFGMEMTGSETRYNGYGKVAQG